MKCLFSLLGLCLFMHVQAQQRWIPKQKIVHENRPLSAQGFGKEIAVQGDFVFIGADGEGYDSSFTNSVPGSGSVRIYKRDTNGLLSLFQVLQPKTRIAFSRFGNQLAVKDDLLMVGAWQETVRDSINQGAVYIFRHVNGRWRQATRLIAPDGSSNDYFGSSVAINDGYAIVSARYDYTDSAGNNPILWAGSAYLFKRESDSSWKYIRKITPSNRNTYTSFFGSQVRMNDSVAIISAHATVYQGGQLGRTKGCYSYALDANGKWIETQNIPYKDTLNTGIGFGKSISLFGSYLLVGADNDNGVGAAYLYKRINGTWVLKQELRAPDASPVDRFGLSVSLSSLGAVIGAPDEDDDADGLNSITSAGSAYVYRWQSDSLVFMKKMIAPDRDINKSRGDLFGQTVVMSNDIILVNAWYDDDDEQNENPVQNAGSIYLLDTTCSPLVHVIDTVLCDGNWLALLDTIFTDSGSYQRVLSSRYKCDSIIQLHIRKLMIDTAVSIQENALIANAENMTYQWIDCETGNSIPDAQQKIFSPQQNGFYAVIVNNGFCADTSSCYPFLMLSQQQIEDTNLNSVYPNPFTTSFHIHDQQYQIITVYNAQGMMVTSKYIDQKAAEINLNYLPSGLYIIRVNNSYLKLIKQ